MLQRHYADLLMIKNGSRNSNIVKIKGDLQGNYRD